eukprot:3775219-Rhodomonas_salina.1
MSGTDSAAGTTRLIATDYQRLLLDSKTITDILSTVLLSMHHHPSSPLIQASFGGEIKCNPPLS